MNIEELMTRDVEACTPQDMLSRAAQIMWERDCGCVPVVDESRHLMGILTDRDICMAAYTKGKPLAQIPVNQMMTRDVKTASVGDSLEAVEALMQVHQIRRLPIVGPDGTLAGVISLNDLARGAERQHNPKMKELHIRRVEATLAAVCRPRPASNITA